MKRQIPIAVITALTALLSGCQSPMVATRSYSFDTRFVVNGKQYEQKTNYTCHYEDLTWISSRGKDWHIREGRNVVRIIGSLEDGARFEIFPHPKTGTGISFCRDRTEAIDARLFIEKDSNRIESFDQFRNSTANRNVELQDAKLSLVSSGLATFIEHQSWPAQVHPARRYYTIQTVTYEKAAWKNRPEIVELIRNKKILWLEPGKRYPFSTWSQNDVAFARLRQFDPNINGYTDPAVRVPLAVEGEEWVFSASSSDQTAIQWRLEPSPSNANEEHELIPSEKFKRWIVYKSNRIEIPLRSYYRTFYQPEHDRLLEFRVEHVDLW